MTKRQDAMKWWNNLSSSHKKQICDTNTELVGTPRKWEILRYDFVNVEKTVRVSILRLVLRFHCITFKKQ